MWKCKKCSEALEDTFDSCWSCGYARDGSEQNVPDKILPVDTQTKNHRQAKSDVRRVLAYFIDFSICVGVAVTFAGDKILVFMKEEFLPFSTVLFLVLMSFRSLVFVNRSIGMVFVGTHLVSENGITKSSWLRILIRDSLTPLTVAIFFVLIALGFATLPEWLLVNAFVPALALATLSAAIQLNNGSTLENGTSSIDLISKTRMRRLPSKS